MYPEVKVSYPAVDLAKALKATHSEETKKRLLKLTATTFLYHFLALLVKFEKSRTFLRDWCKELERMEPFDLLSSLVKNVPLVQEVKDLVKGLRLHDLAVEAIRKSFERAFDGDDAWVRFVLDFFSKDRAYSSTVADITLLPLHWLLLYESKKTGVSSYKLSGVGVYEGFKKGDLAKRPFVGFFTLIESDPETSLEIRNAVRNYSCLSVKTVEIFGTGKLVRRGTPRGSKISKENVIRGSEFQKVATTPFVPERKLAELGSIENLPFDFPLVVWGPITLLTDSDAGKVLVSTEYPHPLLPRVDDWVISKLLSVVNEIPYLPVATLVSSKVRLVEEVPLTWFYAYPSTKSKVLFPSPNDIDKLRGRKGVVALEFEVSGTRERIVAYFPSVEARRTMGASALDAIRIPCDFAETVLKKVENSQSDLNVLLWLEPLVPSLGDATVPPWGVYLTTRPTEFTGGVESVYTQYLKEPTFTTIECVRKLF